MALIAIIDQALPGIQLAPVAAEYQGWLYACVDAALHAYLGSHIAAGFGDAAEIADTHRFVLIRCLEHMRTTALEERLAYRYHGDLGRLLEITMPAVRNVLTYTADLLAQCAATGVSPFDEEGALAAALEQAGLMKWLPIYQKRLEAFRLRLGRWTSFEEFLAFNVDVERLLWQLGLLPWSGPDGLRIEVPIGTDAAELLAAEGGSAAK